jgi:phosphoribosyl-AMP cyclohydrolase
MLKPDFAKSADGLIPVVVQDYKSGDVLMLAYINKQAWDITLDTQYATYWSRSRNQLWKKGESSGNLQRIIDIYLDCDRDTVLFKVDQIGGAACHTGYKSCFFTKLGVDGVEVIEGQKMFDPDKVYKK